MTVRKLTLEELKSMRDEQRRALRQRETEGIQGVIKIGMGTCGIAAGAKRTFDAMLDELDRNEVDQIVVKQTSCLGQCHSEPTVEVAVKGMPTIVYGDVDEEVGRKIIRKHILQGHLINDHIYDKPAVDIVEPKAEE